MYSSGISVSVLELQEYDIQSGIHRQGFIGFRHINNPHTSEKQKTPQAIPMFQLRWPANYVVSNQPHDAVQ
jgi:hypothetical protein